MQDDVHQTVGLRQGLVFCLLFLIYSVNFQVACFTLYQDDMKELYNVSQYQGKFQVNFGVNREANYIDGFCDIKLTSSANWYANIKMVAVLYTILYSDVIIRQRLKSLGSRLFAQRLFRCRSKKT